MAIFQPTISGGGSPTPTGKYELFSRVKDDNNNDVGIVVGYHIDANNNKYAVVCLNAVDRNWGGVQFFTSMAGDITGLPIYTNDLNRVIAKETATYNTDVLLAYATDNNLTSPAIQRCRSKSFTIDGTTYYGQIPNTWEICLIMNSISIINNGDPTAAANPGLIMKMSRVWCSNLYSEQTICITTQTGILSAASPTQYAMTPYFNGVVPILEIPMQ